MVLLSLILALLLPPAESAELHLRSVSDMTVVAAPDGHFTVYIADAQTGGIFTADVADDSSIPLDKFQLRFSSPQYNHPVAVAYEGGTLFVCDAVSGVFAVNLSTNAVERIEMAVRNPTSITIWQGEMAVSDAAINQVYLYSLDSHKSTPLAIPDAKNIARVVISGHDLLVLDGDNRRSIISLPLPDSDGASSKLPTVNKLQGGGIEDFSFYKGVYYLKYTDHVAALETLSTTVLPLKILQGNSTLKLEPGDAISFAGDRMIVASQRNRRVEVLPAQAPVKLSIKSDAAASNAAIIALYSYLLSRGLLPSQPVSSGSPQKHPSLQDLLVGHKVLVPPLGVDSLSKSSTESLHSTLCALNRVLCSQGKLEDLSKPLGRATYVVLPSINLTPSLSTAVKPLHGQTLADYIKNNILSDDLPRQARQRFTTPEKMGDLDSGDLNQFLAMKGFKLLPIPKADYHPGQIIDGTTGEIIGCPPSDKYSIASQPFYIPSSVPMGTTDLNPFKISPAIGVVKSADISVGQAVIEQLPDDAIASIQQNRECMQALVGITPEIISQSIRVLGIKYRFFNRDKAILQVPFEGIASFGSSAAADPERTWSLVINQPLYIAYKTTSLVPGAENTKNPQDGDSGSSLFGLFVLPVEAWESRLLAARTDIDDRQSSLMKLNNLQEDIWIGPTALLKSLASDSIAASFPTSAPDANASLDDVLLRTREELLTAIHYDRSLVPDDMSDVMIGVAEDLGGFQANNRSFWDVNGKSSLRKIDLAGNISSYTDSNPTTDEEAFGVFDEKRDHWIHIAGILASRSGKLGPGLIPTAPLVMIDTASLTDLPKFIDQAVTAGVRIFNLSFANDLTKDDSSLYERLKNKIQSDSGALFVVAAGNDDHHVSEREVPAGLTFDNVIGVTAADGFHKLDQWIDEDDKAHIGTNFGSKYVQLLAPGRRIYSSIYGNRYAAASGSSQAVPQVVAAAAVLYKETGIPPVRLKFRLMYTADWLQNFNTFVWGGGLLNFHRATWEPRRNLLRTLSATGSIYTFSLATSVVNIDRGAFDVADPSNAVGDIPRSLFFNNILRISTQPNHEMRVVYQESDGVMRILKDVVFTSGTISCSKLQLWDENKKQFGAADRDLCGAGIDIRQVFDYVASIDALLRS